MTDISKLTDFTNPNVIHDLKDAYARGLIVECTQAQYDAMATHDPNVVYYITDGSTSYPTAEDMRFDPTGTWLSATSVQDAIEEVASVVQIGSSNTWRGSSSEQVLPAITVTDSFLNYSEVIFVLVLNSRTIVSTALPSAWFSNTWRYVDIPILEGDNKGSATLSIGQGGNNSVVAAWITNVAAWYEVSKQIYVYGRK